MLNEEAITSAGLTKKKVFEEAAAKLNIPLKENVNEKWVEYDGSKTPLENSKTARNNLLFDLIWHRMGDPETAKMRLTTGGFDKARAAARFIRELVFNGDSIKGTKATVKSVTSAMDPDKDPEPDYSVLSVNTLLRYNEMNQIADKLIGIFANHNSNAMMLSLVEKFQIKNVNSIKFGSLLGSNYRLKKRGEDVTNDAGLELLADTVEYYDDNGNLLRVESTLTNAHELIAAAVDAVKDPVLNYLGLTVHTATMGALLGRLGYTANDVGLLFNQPIIKKVGNLVKEGISLGEAIRRVQDEVSDKGKIAVSSAPLTEEVLISGIVEKDTIRTQASTQLAVLQVFKDIHSVSTEVNNIVSITKNTASKAIGSSFGQIYYTQHAQKKMLQMFADENSVIDIVVVDDERKVNTPIIDGMDILNIEDEVYFESVMDLPYAYEQVAFDCNNALLQLCEDLYPYETSTYKSIRAAGWNMSLYDNMSVETINELHKDIIIMAMSSIGDSYFNYDTRMSDGTPVGYYALYKFPEILYKVLHPKTDEGKAYLAELVSKYPFFEHLEVMLNENSTEETMYYDIYVSGSKDGTKDFKYELSSMFEDVCFSKDPKIRDIGTVIILYHHFKTGLGFTKSSFANLFTPRIMDTVLVNHEGYYYNDVLNMLLDDSIDIDAENMISQFVQNHPTNKDFVFMPKGKSLTNIMYLFRMDERFASKDSNGNTYESIELTVKNCVDNNLAIKVPTPDGVEYKVKRFVNINGELWKSVEGEHVLDGDKVRYVRLQILNNHNSKRYLSSTTTNDNYENPSEGDSDYSYTVGEVTADDVVNAYNRYGLSEQSAKVTYLKCLEETLGLNSSSIPESYRSISKEEVFEKLAEIFNSKQVPILVYDEDQSMKILC